MVRVSLAEILLELSSGAPNEAELLRVARLLPTPAEKKRLYATLLDRFPQSHVAANNLALLLIREGRSDEARAVVEPLPELSPELLNTRAVLLSMQGAEKRALALLESIDSLPEARYNRGLLLLRTHRPPAAYAGLPDFVFLTNSEAEYETSR